MEPEGSLQHSQVPTTCPYPEPAPYSPYPQLVPGVKRPGCGTNHPPLSKCWSHERLQLYLYSPSALSWPVIGRTLPFTFLPPNPTSWRSILILSSHLRLFHAPPIIPLKFWCTALITKFLYVEFSPVSPSLFSLLLHPLLQYPLLSFFVIISRYVHVYRSLSYRIMQNQFLLSVLPNSSGVFFFFVEHRLHQKATGNIPDIARHFHIYKDIFTTNTVSSTICDAICKTNAAEITGRLSHIRSKLSSYCPASQYRQYSEMLGKDFNTYKSTKKRKRWIKERKGQPARHI